MSNSKTTAPVQAANHGVAWEKAFGYAQAIKAKDTIYVSGQLSHDSVGNLVAPADLDETGKPQSFDNMEAQRICRRPALLDHLQELQTIL
jgi:enamine deaminase RidA (YjgF/YER057c/UK114 family)